MKSNNNDIIAPVSTYRVQLHEHFTLTHLEEQIDYLHELGIGAIYAAPLFRAVPGSMHGYDVTDPHVINPEVGDLHILKRISQKLKERGMLWIQDIVPNHMAFHTSNERLMDVLERGERSDYAHYFDIHWNHPSPELRGKLMVPFLGSSLEECVEKGELKLAFSEKGLVLCYYENKYPLSISAYKCLLKESMSISQRDELDDLLELATEAQEQKYVQWKRIKLEWIEQVRNKEEKLDLINDVLAKINQNPSKIMNILLHQHYLLTYWKRTEKEINYRRFFTINSLICLRMEDAKVFQDYHSFVFKLYKEGIIDGLRIDHIDGLHDPNEYLNRLRRLFGSKCYVVTEKILEASEDMPAQWPVQGDSGYQFLSQVSQLLTNRQGGDELRKFYTQMVPGLPAYHQMVRANKQRILEQYMGGEWDNLTRYFIDLGLQDRYSYNQIKQALAGLMICLPVYRIYPEDLPLKEPFLKIFSEAVELAENTFPSSKRELNYLRKLFTTPSGARAYVFLNRLMQFTGPLTAKGVEDTTFYVYNAHIAHCEVGDSPSVLGISANDFHEQMVKKAERMPLTMNATATHDTKRGEDARMRLNVLSEFPAEWEEKVREWMELNKPFLTQRKKRTAPTLNDEYFIYQSIVGGLPEDLRITDSFIKRLQAYIVKVVREAKDNSNWEAPDEEYENACTGFVERILRDDHVFVKNAVPFLEKVLDYARNYSLVQALLKATTPGVPDIYQGSELWDLSFVDPDNRRPVDYEKRKHFLDLLSQKDVGFKDLKIHLEGFRKEGIEKIFILWKVLNLRKKYPELFTRGSYLPLLSTRKGVVIAFIRQYQDMATMVVAPIGLSIYNKSQIETDVIIPETYRGEWKNLFTNDGIQAKDLLPVHQVWSEFPVAVFTRSQPA